MVLDQLESGVAELEDGDESDIDPKRLSSLIDRLQVKFCEVVNRARERGDHLIMGHVSAVGWVANTCAMSRNSASDRLCVGEQIESLPQIAQALSAGEIGLGSLPSSVA